MSLAVLKIIMMVMIIINYYYKFVSKRASKLPSAKKIIKFGATLATIFFQQFLRAKAAIAFGAS